MRSGAFHLLIVFFALSFSSKAETSEKRDSLLKVASSKSYNDTVRTSAYINLITNCTAEEKDLALEYYNHGLKWAAKENKHYLFARMHGAYAYYCSYVLMQYSEALRITRIRISHLQKINDYNELAETYRFMARYIYEQLGMAPEAIVAFKKGIYYKRKYKKGQEGYFCYELGWFETYNGNPDSAFVYLQRSYELNDKGNTDFAIELLTWMGNTFAAKKQYEMAVEYQLRAMKLALSINNTYHIGETHRYLATNYRHTNNKDSAILLMRRTVDIYEKNNDRRIYYVASMLINWLSYDGRIAEAKQLIDKFDQNVVVNYKDDLQAYAFYMQAKYQYCYKSKNYKEAVDYLQKYQDLNDSIRGLMEQSEVREQNFKFTFLQQEQAHKLKQQKKELKVKAELQQQRTVAWSLVGIIALVLLLLLLSVRNTRQKKTAYKEISFQKKEIEHQKQLVELKNKEVTDSIHYAKRIQLALLEHKDNLDEFIPENFIFFKPKDIVSGDFYWTTQHNGVFYFAVCDSTGHGVPGAFMSLLNIGFLSEAINEKNIVNVNEVFEYVRKRLISTISKDNQKDGFDGVLISFDKVNRKMHYVAANNVIIHCSNGICTRLPYDRIPVGQSSELKPFTMHTIPIQEGDALYAMTDGYADQFGGPKGKKFMSAKLDALIQSVSSLPIHVQAQNLETTFNEWKGNNEQIDDVCVSGFKITV